MTKKKKSIYPLWVLTPAILIYTLFSVVPIVISLVCSFTDWNMGRLYTDNHYPENRNRISACACYGKKNTGKRDHANHLLCSMCNQYHSCRSII